MEDILLSRLFHEQPGTFVDVGAHHPFVDNTTYFFYERGWRGVNVEPIPYLHRLLVEYRPQDLNIPVAVSDRDGALTFYHVPQCDGLSTLSTEVASYHRRHGLEVIEGQVQVQSIASLVAQFKIRPPDLLSIDVEGHESQVIEGIPLTIWRPAVIVVESTLPLSQTASHRSWEPILLSHDYLFAAFNGVNRFYLRSDLRNQLDLFLTPVSVLDNFIRYETMSLRQQIQKLENRVHELEKPTYDVEGTGVAFLHKQMEGESRLVSQGSPFVLVWEGPQTALHSFALANRAMCGRLIERGHEIVLSQSPAKLGGAPEVPLPEVVAARLRQPPTRAVDFHVRHEWPPDFTAPPTGHWVLMQPWEYGSLPREWVAPIVQGVDEVWAYTHFVRECYLKSGVPEELVHVVPLGVDPTRFHPRVTPLRLKTTKRFKFLFVGGTIARKGIDILLAAYMQSFRSEDDVCLVIQDMGVGSFYRGQTAERLVAQYQALSAGPEIDYIERSMSQQELAGLYTACDCLVHPYRGEGFGLPIAEAMASGLPVIVTDYGAALDFCTKDNAFLIPARVVHFPEKRVGDLETVDFPWLAEPDRDALASLLRFVVDHPDEARAQGKLGCEHIRARFTWGHAADVVEARLRELRTKPIRRLNRHITASVPTPATPLRTANRPGVSLCVIVKNEEANLPACLGSARDLVDEMIVVDTGSTDRTKELAAGFGARVFDFPWVDSFAAARNESLRHATGEWIFWLDADDRLDEDNRGKLRKLFAQLKDENVAYSMKCHCLPDSSHGAATAFGSFAITRSCAGNIGCTSKSWVPCAGSVAKFGSVMWSFITPVTKIPPCADASWNAICDCCNWKTATGPMTRSRCLTSARSVTSWVGLRRRCPCCVEVWSVLTPATRLCANYSP
jgi:FkbM family methyltransferase